MDHDDHCNSCNTTEKLTVGRNLKIASAVTVGIFLATFLPIPILKPLQESFIIYFKLIWWAILLGLLLGGVIDYFVPEAFIYNYLGQNKKRSLFFAVISGFILSACSHGILAIAIQLYKKGASIPSTITFLLATPWANLPVTILMFGFFGLKALLFIAAAMIIALITGFIYMFLQKKNLIEPSMVQSEKQESYNWNHIKHFDLRKSIQGVWHGSVHLANMVLWWIMIGFLAATIIQAYVPAHIFTQFFGPTFFGLIITLLFATIIEVCSEGSAPIAFEIFQKTGAFGNPFVFLMAGVATDYTEIGLIWTTIGKKTAIWLPIITVPQILLVGLLFNWFL